MTVEEMKKKKIELGYTNQTLAEKSGVPASTIQKILSGRTTAPRAETIQALVKALCSGESPVAGSAQKNTEGRRDERYEGRRGSDRAEGAERGECGSASGVIREGAAAYVVPKRHTVEDYMALPEERRVELIDGVFYDMASPLTPHQAIAGWIYSQFLGFVRAQKGSCYPFIAPLDVQLDQDAYTIVQPDVMILCDRGKLKNGRIFGAPDFILEVLSPSTRKKDLSLKLQKYMQAGVREYWILDPDRKQLMQYDLENLGFPIIYSADREENSRVPVLIWEGKCSIDLKEMFEEIAFLYD